MSPLKEIKWRLIPVSCPLSVIHALSSHARLPLCVICNTINRLQMAWILLNIHRATEAMGNAAVFWCGVTLHQAVRPTLFHWLAYQMLKNYATGQKFYDSPVFQDFISKADQNQWITLNGTKESDKLPNVERKGEVIKKPTWKFIQTFPGCPSFCSLLKNHLSVQSQCWNK